MPTHEESDGFLKEFAQLTSAEQRQFLDAVGDFVQCLKAGVLPAQMPKHVGIRRFQSRSHELWEMRWGPNRRALFRYGTSPHTGDAHIIWENIGTHNIYKH
jgi:hypothetical protein